MINILWETVPGCSENLSYFSLLLDDLRSTCVAEPLSLCCKNTHLGTSPLIPEVLKVKVFFLLSVSLSVFRGQNIVWHTVDSIYICSWTLLFLIFFSHLLREPKVAVVLVCSIVTTGLLHACLFSYTEFSILLSSLGTQLTGQHQYW